MQKRLKQGKMHQLPEVCCGTTHSYYGRAHSNVPTMWTSCSHPRPSMGFDHYVKATHRLMTTHFQIPHCYRCQSEKGKHTPCKQCGKLTLPDHLDPKTEICIIIHDADGCTYHQITGLQGGCTPDGSPC